VKPKHSELSAWRQSHFKELESTLSVLKGIRDDPEASNKDRIEASKSIGRLLSAMSPAKASAKVQEKQQEHKPSPEEREIIEARLAA
jgi:hypothetical protein